MAERYTPEQITELAPREVFVFGSNTAGIHGGGAARFAFEHFGAEWGVGEGLTGRCYALPTMGSLEETAAAVERFLAVAEMSADLTFLVTKVGTGIAGRPVSEIAPLFARRLPNVVLPREFVEALA